jgi:signal transduction histidine kinase
MFCTDIPAPIFLIFSKTTPALLYYSHVPTAIISLFIGFFVFYKNRTLVSKILFTISVVFSLWVFLNLIVWTNIDSKIIMFSWSFFGILNALLFILSFYFVYVFINKKDLSFGKKTFIALLLLPVILLTPKNLLGFDLVNCEARENVTYFDYVFGLELAISLVILVFSFLKYRKAEKEFKRQIVLLTVGIELFLFSFFITGFLASYLVEKGIITDFGLEQYGLFGMTVFMGFLAYLIVRYKAFDIKMLAVQALVVSIVILVASEFFFVQNFTNKILTGITLFLSMIGGWMMVRSVKLEVRRKEELQMMSDKLAMANDKLRTLDNAKSEFISIASHQLRTPLTAVKGYISLLIEGSYGKIDTDQKGVLQKVYQANERLVDLVEDMLNLSRIESGRMEYNFEKVNLAEVCQEIYDTFAIRAKEQKLKLELLSPKSALPEVTTDRNKIREIISNLVDNAIKYTPSGSVKIETIPTETGVRVAVTDTGIGVPKEELPYLFAKFSRGKDTKRLNTGGTGLGLHVGKRMIESLHGQLGVESEGAGKGSTFYVEVPREIEE